MGSSLVGLEVDGKLVPNIAGQIDFKRELAMVSAHFTRAVVLEVIGTFVEVLGLQFGCKDTIQPAVFGVPRSCLDVA
jgi:hypothetical protein